MASELFELKVIVEAAGWHEIAPLMDIVDRALDPHRQTADGTRRWSVTARRVPGEQSQELLRFIDRCGRTASGDDAVPADRLTA